ncbi:MAG: hypothetical protein E2O76_02880 [Caldithrix sp.]|nr:MAG: hypothetical protein E2O76_02880 [Caldithrix sp.]
MFKEIILFELKFRLKKKLMAYTFFFVFFLMTFLSITTDTVTIGGGIGNVNVNSPFVIMQSMTVMTVVGIFIIVPLMSIVIIRDFDLNTYPTFFTTQISKFNYLIGRLTGGFLVTLFSFLGLVAGLVLGSFMPWIDQERIGPFMISPYIFTWLVFVVPGIIISGSFFFALGTMTRSILWTYVGVVVFFVFYAVSGNLLGDIENKELAALLDPFGFTTFRYVTQYWTVIEKNTLVLPLDNALLLNRFLWTGVALLSLALTVWRFKFTEPVKRFGKKKKEPQADGDVAVFKPTGAELPVVSKNFSRSAYLKQFMKNTSQEFLGIVKTVPFIIIALFGLFNIFGNVVGTERIFGTDVHMVTRRMVQAIQGGYSVFLVIILTIYGGELIWRSRKMGVNEYFDALPVPDWVPFASKLLSLIGVIYFMQVLAMIMGVILQFSHGFFAIEFGLYFKALFINIALNTCLLAFLIMFIHVLVNNKHLGHGMVISFYIVFYIAFGALGFDHYLYIFAGAPSSPYSDMNGFGHFVTPLFWFNTYWFFFAMILSIMGLLFWVRGTDSGFKPRLQEAKRRRSRANQFALVLAVAAFFLTGGFIFYNTNVLNDYRTDDDTEEAQVDYEKKYKKYEGIPQPRIVDVNTEVDFYPEQRDFDIRGRYILVNKTNSAIDSVHVRKNYPNNVKQIINNFKLGESDQVLADTSLSYYIYKLQTPMQPGDSLELTFDFSYKTIGFLNDGSNRDIVFNGSFINNSQYFPHIGYADDFEISTPNDRRKHKLPPKRRMNPITDTAALQNTYLGGDADWVNFETIVSTSRSQIAISPGYLQREWQENGRRYFHYKMDIPILHFYSYLSAEYEVKRERWNGLDIEIYYHKPHAYNLDKMIKSIKKSITYFSENFSPYQHKQIRIIEFPRYAAFAQSFPNTIPYSEAIGFIANLKDEEDLDYVFYVTAHEVAHQWWAHQVIGGNVQGATVMSETLSQYSALMVMEKEYGREKMRRFLKYELDRYLKGRSSEQFRELPLIYNENQGYIHYRKGSLVMYALRDYIGEEKLNGALRKYIADVAYQEAPFTTSLEFLSYIREVVPDSLNYIIEDWFETITLYDNRAEEIVYSEIADGKYRVELNLKTRKMRADSLGRETEVAIADWIEIGVLGEDGEELYMQKHKLTGNEVHIEVIVDKKPVEAGIDPYNKLIDRNPDDNVKKVARK